MKFSCTQENLHNGLTLVSNIASKSNTLPILSNVLFKVKEGSIDLSVTNLEIGVNYRIRGKIEQEGSFTLPAKILSDYVGLLPKEKIELDLRENQLSIESSTSKTKIKGIDASEFPVIPQVPQKNALFCKLEDMCNALEQTLFSVSSNEIRPEISGIYLHRKTESSPLTLVATDSYRLAEKRVHVTESPDSSYQTLSVIVPSRTAHELLRILSNFRKNMSISSEENKDTDFSFIVSDNQILFRYDNFDMVSRLIEGQFPDYEQLVPESWTTRAFLSCDEFINAVKTSSLFARSGIYDVVLQFQEKGVSVSSVNSQIGENTTFLSGRVEGRENTIVLNYRYLLDGLFNINSPELVLEVTDSNTPCVIRSAMKSENDERDYFYLVMPIRQ
jgi:DNA polymerase-3 subunit beta